ncbi:GNAT family N-acetyltransferase [Pseudodesulfovibrio sp. F-1]|uniref:GNAT family N-acetyltransferase n=1 Tax=Pseudodesulfovibrio alkaliphilus TaxID=2661613 RepID=A0A7K1KRS3_9BACT|nr:GNAT family N-acetyltransferase [Pseudodesulfovibrio alkaliphilus]MUM78785.1 GNAT family N-acetyltransferase [Pseudodesulfovibrio alkaliphilus]
MSITPHTRAATQDDVFAMEQIMRDAFAQSYATFMPEQYVREWYDANTASRTVRIGLSRAGVAEIMGRIVGFVMYTDNTITELWVDPAYQGQGAGRALIHWIEEAFRAMGFPTITLYCYEANGPALEFYARMRFRRASSFDSRDVPGGPVRVYTMLKMVSRLKR